MINDVSISELVQFGCCIFQPITWDRNWISCQLSFVHYWFWMFRYRTVQKSQVTHVSLFCVQGVRLYCSFFFFSPSPKVILNNSSSTFLKVLQSLSLKIVCFSTHFVLPHYFQSSVVVFLFCYLCVVSCLTLRDESFRHKKNT